MFPEFTDSRGWIYSFEIAYEFSLTTIRVRFHSSPELGNVYGAMNVSMTNGKILTSNVYDYFFSPDAVRFFEKIWKNKAFL